MPHIVMLYTANLEADGHVAALCRKLADTLLAQRDEAGNGVFPPGGTRVFAYPAAHHAVSDGNGDYGFVYINLRMAKGRSDAVKKATGDALLAVAQDHFEPAFATRHVGLTLQVDESTGQVYDGKGGNLRDLFRK